ADKKPLFERMLANFDKNKDGKLDKEEFAAGTKTPDRPAADTPRERPRGDQPKPEGLGDGQQAFKFLDRNGDGKLQKDELPERLRENFARLDANGDGVIDATEFARVAGQVAGLVGRRPEGAPAEGARVDTARLKEMFTQLDANKDGKVTLDEVPEDKKEQ